MKLFFDFINPVDSEIVQYAQELPYGSIGNEITFINPKNVTTFQKQTIIILGVPEDRNTIGNDGTGKNMDEFRKEFYRLFKGNWKTKIVDVGDLKVGETFTDTLVILQEFVVYLLKNDFLPVLIGGSQALTYALYRAFDQLEQRVNLVVADAKFDLGRINDALHSGSYLTKIIMDKPGNLQNFTNIGFQTFLNPQEEINLMDHLMFEVCRLGVLKKEIENAEPLLREADLLSIDIGVVRMADAPANKNAFISGISADDICKISRYAGLSDKMKIFSIFEYNPKLDKNSISAQLLSQMIWYYIEGINIRKPEFPNTNLEGFKKYIVLIEEENHTFYKSEETERWWMEINVADNNKTKRKTLIPCTYSDYVTACKLEIPERWYLNRRKFD